MNTEIRYLAQQLLHAGLSPLCERDRRLIAASPKRVHTARNVNQVFEPEPELRRPAGRQGRRL